MSASTDVAIAAHDGSAARGEVARAAIIIVGLVSLVVRGLNLGLDFTGGTEGELSYAKPVDQDAVHAALEKAGLKDTVVQHLGVASERPLDSFKLAV